MLRTLRAVQVTCLVLPLIVAAACRDNSKKKASTAPEKRTNAPVMVNPKPDPLPTPGSEKNPIVTACSSSYAISGKANPFLAGAPDTATLAYDTPVDDTVADNAPVLVVPTDRKCFEAGRRLYFSVKGQIAHDSKLGEFTDADGQAERTPSHALGSVNGISDLTAPINSLVAVFLDEKPFASRLLAPPALNFSQASARDFSSLAPRIGQLFFVGNGRNAAGSLQAFIVPAGTTRLYLGIMDEFEWSNNEGELSGTIQWVNP